MDAILKPTQRTDTNALQVSNFDRVAGLLVALLIMVGVTVSGLFIVWLTVALV